jgi:hypothetical protein
MVKPFSLTSLFINVYYRWLSNLEFLLKTRKEREGYDVIVLGTLGL